jgi:uncharacterized protein YjbK
MKARKGFVSNSSSTSFIVHESEKARAEDNLTLISVPKLIKLLGKLKAVREEIDEELGKLGLDFMSSIYGGDVDWYLERLEKLGDDYYISAPYDRDWACQMGIDFGTFEGDL